MDCLFCKIIKGEIPCHKVYEDDKIFAFLDIKPVNLGHTLVIPKKHVANLLEIESEELQYLISKIPFIAKAIMRGLDYSAFNLQVNNGAIAGQVIDHLHFHIVPRKEGDGHKLFESGDYGEQSAEEIATKIRENL